MSKKTTKKKYIPNSKEKYMCAKHKKYFGDELIRWNNDRRINIMKYFKFI